MGEGLDYLIQGFQFVVDWFQTGIYFYFVELMSFFTITLTSWWLELSIASMKFAWDVASTIIENLAITDDVLQYWNSIDPDVKGLLTALSIPDAFSLIMNAYVTRFVRQTTFL